MYECKCMQSVHRIYIDGGIYCRCLSMEHQERSKLTLTKDPDDIMTKVQLEALQGINLRRWNFPIFEVAEQLGDRVLSLVSSVNNRGTD